MSFLIILIFSELCYKLITLGLTLQYLIWDAGLVPGARVTIRPIVSAAALWAGGWWPPPQYPPPPPPVFPLCSASKVSDPRHVHLVDTGHDTALDHMMDLSQGKYRCGHILGRGKMWISGEQLFVWSLLPGARNEGSRRFYNLGAFSWLKTPNSTFTLKTLLRYCDLDTVSRHEIVIVKCSRTFVASSIAA